MDQVIIKTFNRLIKAPDHPTIVREIDEFFTYMEFLGEDSPNYEAFQVAKQKFFAELKKRGYTNRDLTIVLLLGPSLPRKCITWLILFSGMVTFGRL